MIQALVPDKANLVYITDSADYRKVWMASTALLVAAAIA